MKTKCRNILLLVITMVLMFAVRPGLHGSEEELSVGVVVEEIPKDSIPGDEDLKIGDILISWRVPSASLEDSIERVRLFESPFEWIYLVAEYAPRGVVEVRLLRNGAEKWLKVRLDNGIWRIRPLLPPDLLQEYRKAESSLESGNPAEIFESWRHKFPSQVSTEYLCWAARKAAKKLTWSGSYDVGIQILDSALRLPCGTFSASVLQQALGEARERQGRLAEASAAYAESLRLRENCSEPTDILRAANIHGIGVVNAKQGNIDAAQGFFEESMAAVAAVAPESIAVAKRLNSLGNIASMKGDLQRSSSLYEAALEIYIQRSASGVAIAPLLNNLGLQYSKLGNLERSTEHYIRVLELITAGEKGQSLIAANTLNILGYNALQLGNLSEAEAYLRRSLDIWSSLAPDAPGRSSALSNLGDVLRNRGSFVESEKLYMQGWAIATSSAGELSLEAAACVYGLGQLSIALGDLNRAREYIQMALKFQKTIDPQSLGVGEALTSLGGVAWEQGKLSEAEVFLGEARSILEDISPVSLAMSACLHNLGILAWSQRNFEHATDLIHQSKEILSKIAPESSAFASSLASLGGIWGERRNLKRAMKLNLRALDIYRRLDPKSKYVAISLSNIGLIESSQGNHKEGLEYLRYSIDIFRDIAPNSLSFSLTLTNFSAILLRTGSHKEALKHYKESFEIRRDLAPNSLYMAFGLDGMAAANMATGDFQQAQQFYTNSITIRRALAPNSIEFAYSLRKLATISLMTDSPPSRTLKFVKESLDVFDQQLERLGGSSMARLRFRSDYYDHYRDAIDIYLKLGNRELAFHTLERSRARTFVEQLLDRDVLVPKEIKDARNSIAVEYDRTLGRLNDPSMHQHRSQVAELENQLVALRYRLDDIGESLRRIHRNSGTLYHSHPLDVDSARKSLDQGTLVVTYSMSEASLRIFAVSKFADLLVVEVPISENSLRAEINDFRSMIAGFRSDDRRHPALEEQAHSLYAMLLDPIADHIQHAERILILPDGPLHNLPWSALRRTTPDGRGQYLIEWKPVHLTLSVTVYSELRKLRRVSKESPPTFQIAAFGDPRYPSSQEEAAAHGDVYVRSTADRNFFEWKPLPHTREEVQGIVGLFPSSQAYAYLGSSASEERAKALDKSVQIIHFAAHAHLDERIPLNSFLALSIPEELPEMCKYATKPLPECENGLLQAREIYENLRIDADLVVLSACQTALGAEKRGEGLIGLTRAFHHAGARSVISSLWNVNDRSTAELMVSFYRHLRDGETKDEALRAAQIELIQQAKYDEDGNLIELGYAAPYHWAAFQLYGDWK